MSQIVDTIAQNAGFFFILLAVMWAAQFVLAYVQMRRFNRRILEVRQWGKTAVGLGGDRYRGRAYAVLTADEKGNIVNADFFSGSTVFARVRPAPEVVGMTIDQILADPEAIATSKKGRLAFVSAATYLKEAFQAKPNNQPSHA